ncbi:MAG TPA: TadE family protein [Pirellulales bacterium]|nr:TadE family protein [Pirellulales bacterium]
MPATAENLRPRRRRRPARSRRGVAAVEFALVAPLFLILLLGVIEYGRMLVVQQVVNEAAREGVRAAVCAGAQTSDVLAAANDRLTASSISGAAVTVSPSPPGSAANGDPVSVTVEVPFSAVSWLHSSAALDATTLSATCTMRSETQQ